MGPLSPEPVIAVLMDCDDTLCDDSTDFLLSQLGIDPAREFWPRVTPKITAGWDAPLAYSTELVKITQERKIDFTKSTLGRIGSQLKFYKGVPRVFEELKKHVTELGKQLGIHLQIEFYVISSGFEELLLSSQVAPYANELFGCTFDYDESGRVLGSKSIVSFTEKTKFLFAINKGIMKDELRRNPASVNEAVDDKDRRVPFQQMIYLGDGPTDIPCFSTIMKLRGKGIGIIKQNRPERGLPLWKGKRLTVGPYHPDYGAGSDLRTMLEQVIDDIALGINQRSKLRLYP